MLLSYILVIAILISGMVFSIISNRLTLPAAVTGAVIGLSVFVATGFLGLAVMTTFFVLGTMATSHKLKVKQAAGLAELNKGKRTTGQVLANAGVAAILSVLAFIYPAYLETFGLMIAASFSAAAADTLSSELGNVYGRRFYNILTFKKNRRGMNGVISFEGTMLGMVGSVIVAIVYALFAGIDVTILYIIIAGTIGNLTDSVLGAALENKGYLSNNAVNTLNTLSGALAALILSVFNH